MYAAAVQFTFSKSELTISEGEDLPSQLSIIKNGQQEMTQNISFRVSVTPGNAPNQKGISIEEERNNITVLIITVMMGINFM